MVTIVFPEHSINYPPKFAFHYIAGIFSKLSVVGIWDTGSSFQKLFLYNNSIGR